MDELFVDSYSSSVFVTFSARTSASQTQRIIDSGLDKRRKGVYGPPPGIDRLYFSISLCRIY